MTEQGFLIQPVDLGAFFDPGRTSLAFSSSNLPTISKASGLTVGTRTETLVYYMVEVCQEFPNPLYHSVQPSDEPIDYADLTLITASAPSIGVVEGDAVKIPELVAALAMAPASVPNATAGWEESAWVDAHGSELERYADSWIAIFGPRVIASGDSLDEVYGQVAALGISDALIVRAPSRPDRPTIFVG